MPDHLPLTIPARLNGYDIIASCSVFIDVDRPEEHETVILGIDLTRRHSKYVTAMVDGRPAEPVHEWYWGHYFEDPERAMIDFHQRTRLPHLAEHAVAKARELADLKRDEQRHEADR